MLRNSQIVSKLKDKWISLPNKLARLVSLMEFQMEKKVQEKLGIKNRITFDEDTFKPLAVKFR